MVSAMQSLGFLYNCVVSLLLFFATTSCCHAESNNHTALFVFGDSVYDPGNNDFLNISIVYKANFPPYGETFFKFPTGRFSDGRLIPDFVAKHANLPYWKPYLAPGHHEFVNGANFASAGSCVLTESDPNTINLHMQLRYFKNVSSSLKQQLGETKAKKLLKNAVYLFSSGGNDCWLFEFTKPNATQSQKQEYTNLVIGNITEVFKEIHKAGGRKFAFQNIAFMDCQPETKQSYGLNEDECYQDISELALLLNNALANATRQLETQLPGFKYSIFDYYNLLFDMTYNPSKYGLKVVESACCGTGTYRGSDCGISDYDLCSDPSTYMYWDGEHLTEYVNSQVVEQLWNGGTNISSPFNMKQLFELELDAEIQIKNASEYDNGALADE
ncbi:GDSL lipase-like [Pistacia vera]|uniref:GDSL lipase-like n=1 Tax=Pistacia vera TaxID=55513 RepID=UPI001262FCBC|nr:GDSL lipase-like [Pistacia vera]